MDGMSTPDCPVYNTAFFPPITLPLPLPFPPISLFLDKAFSKEACCKMPSCTSLHKCHSNTISNTCRFHSLLICLERSECTYLDFYRSVAPFGPLTSLSHGTICTFWSLNTDTRGYYFIVEQKFCKTNIWKWKIWKLFVGVLCNLQDDSLMVFYSLLKNSIPLPKN